MPEGGWGRWDEGTQQDVGLGDAFQTSGINLILQAALCPWSLDLWDRKEIKQGELLALRCKHMPETATKPQSKPQE